jgi:tRNA(Arg) A34 adenosine deaminase TadA
MSTTKQQITAIIYDKRGRVLSVGQNSYLKTHPMQAKYARKVGEEHKIFLHAEIAAITKCRNLSKAAKMIVFRYGHDGSPMLAKPCKVCASAISAVGIPEVEHT